MPQHKLEFFKLDEIDRKVLCWLIKHVKPNSVKCWAEFIAQEYKRRGVTVDGKRLFEETDLR